PQNVALAVREAAQASVRGQGGRTGTHTRPSSPQTSAFAAPKAAQRSARDPGQPHNAALAPRGHAPHARGAYSLVTGEERSSSRWVPEPPKSIVATALRP